MVNLRYGMIVVAFVVTLLVLFLGWFAYLNWGLERPLEKEIGNLEGVEKFQVQVDNAEAQISFQLAPWASLQQVHQSILEIARKEIGNRQLDIEVVDNPDQEMLKLWQQSQLAIEEGISRHQYRLLAEVASDMKDSLGLTRSEVSLSEEYIYFQLQKGEHQLLEMIPRHQDRVEEE